MLFIKFLSTFIYIINGVSRSEATLFYLTLSTQARSIFTLFDLGNKIKKIKGNKDLPIYILGYIFIFTFWNKLTTDSLFNFVNSNVLFFITYFIFTRIQIIKKNKEKKKSLSNFKIVLKKWDIDCDKDIISATISTNIIVCILYWSGVFFLDKKEGRHLKALFNNSFFKKEYKGAQYCYVNNKKDNKCLYENRISLFDSIISHLLLPLYWFYTLFKNNKITLSGTKLSLLQLSFQLFYITVYYLFSRNRMSGAIDELNEKINKWVQLGGNVDFSDLKTDSSLARDFGYGDDDNLKQEKETLALKMILNIKKIQKIFVQSRFYNTSSKYIEKSFEDECVFLIPFLIPDNVDNSTFLKKFYQNKEIDYKGKLVSLKESCVSSTGFVPYNFLRLKPTEKNIDYFKKLNIYGTALMPLIIYGIDLGIKKIKK